MDTQKSQQKVLVDHKVNVKVKLSAMWASFMFLYIYVDYFHLYMPGTVEDILDGKVFVFQITQGFLMTALGTLTVPALMIFLSVALPASANRAANMSVALIFIPYTLFNLAGEAWMHMIFAAVVEVMLLCFIFRCAWKWPRTTV